MTILTYIEPQLRYETVRSAIKAKHYSDIQATRLMFMSRFADVLKTCRIDPDKREVFAAAKLVPHPHREGHFVYEWHLEFTNHTKAMMFQMSYTGDLEQKGFKTRSDLVRPNED